MRVGIKGVRAGHRAEQRVCEWRSGQVRNVPPGNKIFSGSEGLRLLRRDLVAVGAAAPLLRCSALRGPSPKCQQKCGSSLGWMRCMGNNGAPWGMAGPRRHPRLAGVEAGEADDLGENTLQPRFTNNKFFRWLSSCDAEKKRRRRWRRRR